jgi:hypothetical protein
MAGSGNVLKKVARLFSTRPVMNCDPSGYFHVRADILATAIDLLIYAIPALIAINRTLKLLKTVGPAYKLLDGSKWVPTILNITTKALTRLGLKIQLATGILSFISTSALMIADLSIGKLIAWGVGKIFKTKKGVEKQFVWFGPKIEVTYIIF